MAIKVLKNNKDLRKLIQAKNSIKIQNNQYSITFLQSIIKMNDSLLPSTHPKQQMNEVKYTYDPFECPPNLERARYHRKATQVGKMPNLHQDINVCPCCDNVINKQQYNLWCDVDEFVHMGIGYSLFFILYKYFALILLFISVVSGGIFYFLVAIECKKNCFTFFGIPIMSDNVSLVQSLHRTEVIHIITAVLILIVVILVKHFMHKDIMRLQAKTLCPSQYTIMIQNLPQNIDVIELKHWIQENFKCHPIAINIAYDTSKISQAIKERQSLMIQKNKLKIKKNLQANLSPKKIAQLQRQINQIKGKIKQKFRLIEGYYNNQIQYEQIGTVFVTFDKADQVEKILQTHQKTFANILLQKITHIFSIKPLKYKNNQIVIYRAPAPRQVIWQNLQFSYFRHVLFQFLFIVGMIIFVLLTFRVQFTLVNYMYTLRHEGEKTGRKQIIIQALLMSLVILILNILLRISVQLLTNMKKFYSYTKQQSSFCSYYSLVFIINSCFTIYVVHESAVQGANHLLLYDIHTIMLINAFSQPLFKIFDPMMWLRVFQRYRIQKMEPEQNPYTQAYVHSLWEGFQISNADNYQYIIRVLFITVWFANIAPLGVIFSLLGMLCDYWIIKYLFINVYRQPKNLSKQITKSLNFMEILPLVYISGIMPFLYQVTFTLDLTVFLTEFFHYGITTVIILFCILGYLYKFRPKEKYISKTRYTDVQLGFGFNYQTENPLTKFAGQKKFLEQILSHDSRLSTRDYIGNLMNTRKDSILILQEKRKIINKLKLNLNRKVSSNIDNLDFLSSQQYQLKDMKKFKPQTSFQSSISF